MLQSFKEDLVNRDISFITSKWIIEKIPHVFSDDLDSYIRWKENLGSKIGVDSRAIAITGSASVGFSLNPEKNLKIFSAASDIDVAIISQYHFDIAWHFLRNLGTKIHSFSQREKNAIEDHRTRLIYWGTIATDKIIQLLPFGQQWVNALNEMSDFAPTKGHEVNARIYKDFEALRAYSLNNLRQIKEKIITSY